MTGSLVNQIRASFRNSRQSASLALALSVLGLEAGCNGSFPFVNSGTDNPTEFSGIEGCATSFSDSDFNYGFDLPSDATLVRTKNESDSLTNSLWTITTDSGALVNIITRVQAVSDGVTLGSLVSAANDNSLSAGADLLTEEEVALSNNGAGFETMIRFDGLTTFRAQSLSDSQLYTVEAVIEDSARTTASDDLLSAMVLSLCVGN